MTNKLWSLSSALKNSLYWASVISFRFATCYLGDGDIFFCPASSFAVCFLISALSLTHTQLSRAAPISPPPPSFPLFLCITPSLPPSAESHSGSLDQTLRRSRQRKVPSGSPISAFCCTSHRRAKLCCFPVCFCLLGSDIAALLFRRLSEENETYEIVVF